MVAIDYDEVVVGKLWQSAVGNLDILPLVVNFYVVSCGGLAE